MMMRKLSFIQEAMLMPRMLQLLLLLEMMQQAH